MDSLSLPLPLIGLLRVVYIQIITQILMSDVGVSMAVWVGVRECLIIMTSLTLSIHTPLLEPRTSQQQQQKSLRALGWCDEGRSSRCVLRHPTPNASMLMIDVCGTRMETS